MKICGIVAEYNPFHNGHAYHCEKTRQLLGDETALAAVMSGNFVQRGDFAILDKYQRAAMAVQNGLDLVIELPLAAALSSAEDFSRGAIAVLEQMGCVTHLSFGSECGDITRIQKAARADRSLVHRYMTAGASYAAALQQAVSTADPDAGALFSHPNNTLGIEYCAALDTLGSQITPITIFRDGAAHDSADAHVRPSASFLRTQIMQAHLEICQTRMPASAFSILSKACDTGMPLHRRQSAILRWSPICAVCLQQILFLTQGISTDCTTVFIGQFSKTAIFLPSVRRHKRAVILSPVFVVPCCAPIWDFVTMRLLCRTICAYLPLGHADESFCERLQRTLPCR